MQGNGATLSRGRAEGERFGLEPTAFGELLVLWNRLDAAGFAAWDFLPGMRFGDRAAWWREGAERDAPHEGLDILWYRTGDGRRLSLGPGARVPALWAGEVVAIVPDFLGTSVFVAHGGPDEGGRRALSICGHVDPRPELAPGSLLCDGDEVGRIADPRAGRTAVPAHLHLTIALIARGAGLARLDWAALRDPSRALLLDPLPVLIAAQH